MKKLLLLFSAVLIFTAMPALATDYGDVILSSNGVTDSDHFPEIWDLTAGDITISFTYDGNGLVDDFGGNAHAWAELGVRSLECETFDLIADGGDTGTQVGYVKVCSDGTYLYVTYVITESGWFITKTHLAVGDDLADIPQTKNGNPIPGKFEYPMVLDPLVTEYAYPPIDISAMGQPLYIATHAQVVIAIDGCYDEVWQIGDVEGDDCDGDLTNYANEFNWKKDVGAGYNEPVGPCELGPGLKFNEPIFTDPFIVGTTPLDEFPYNSNCRHPYATDFDVQWTGGLPLGGKLIVSWSPGQSASEEKEVSGDGISSTTLTAIGTPSAGQGWFWDTYPLVEDSVDVGSLANDTHTIRFQHTQGDGTFWDWIRLEKPCERWETAWGGNEEFPGKNWATYFTYDKFPSDFNPTWQVEGSGVWLATDYDWTANTFDPDPGQDMDDKLILQKAGGHGEGDYNLPSTPPNPWANHAVWFDRDGVDLWQAQMWGAIDGVTYNTGGTYDVVITLHADDASSGTAYMTINGAPQGFYVPNWHSGPADLMPAGMTFTGDMEQLQVFYGLYGYGVTHNVSFEDITVTQ